jgi:nitrogen regulatory protein P-II 1
LLFDKGMQKEELKMKELNIFIRPEKLEDVKEVLDRVHCGGMTLSTAMGCGTQKGGSEATVNEIKGYKTTINLLPKVKVEVVVNDKDVETVIAGICEVCATDHVGDGKIFIKDVEDAVRIRTGERGVKAL